MILVLLLAFMAVHVSTEESCTQELDVKLLLIKSMDVKSEISVNFTGNQEDVLENVAFDATKKTVIYCFGYDETFESDTTQSVVNGYLARGDTNIFVLDWSKNNAGNYFLEAIPSLVKVNFNHDLKFYYNFFVDWRSLR